MISLSSFMYVVTEERKKKIRTKSKRRCAYYIGTFPVFTHSVVHKDCLYISMDMSITKRQVKP